MEINDDGTIDPIAKTAVGLTGTVSTITDYTGAYVANEPFENSLSDSFYPITDWSTASLTARGSKDILVDFFQTGTEKEWEINPGKADKSVEEYVSLSPTTSRACTSPPGTAPGTPSPWCWPRTLAAPRTRLCA